MTAYKKHKQHAAQAGIVIVKKIPNKGIIDGPHTTLAKLPLQDERNKVVHPTVDVSKPLFTPKEAQYSKPPTAPYSNQFANQGNPLFESSIKNISPPKLIYGSPIEEPPTAPSHHQGLPVGYSPSSGHGAPSGSSAPSGHDALSENGTPSSYLSAPHASFGPPSGPPSHVTSPPGYIDDSLLHTNTKGFEEPQFDFNKPISEYFQNIQNQFPNLDLKQMQQLQNTPGSLYLSNGPSPFEINSFGGDLSQFDTTAQHPAFSGPLKTNYGGSLNSYAPTYLGTGGSQSHNSNLQYDTGILEHKGPISLPEYDVVKSVSYELPAHKRH